MDVARLGLAVDSSQVEKGTVSLHQLTGAAGQASAAARQLAANQSAFQLAAQRAQATVLGLGASVGNTLVSAYSAAGGAVQRFTSLIGANIAALRAQFAAEQISAQQRTMMVYQLNDVAVSLASGMNPAMVAMQQGSQILQGGFMPAVRTLGDLVGGLVTKFWPLAAVVGAVSAAIAGMTHEINKTSDVTVGFGDTALAVWQLVSEGIYTFIQPAVELLAGWFGTAWNWVVQATKDAGNWIIRTVVGAIEYVKTSVSTLPAVFLVAGQGAAQGLADGVAAGVNAAIGNLNSLSAAINQIAGKEVIGAIAPMSFGKIDLGGAAAQESYNNAWAGYANTVGALGSRDIMGEMFGAISGRAQELALARQEMDALGGSAKAANDNVKALADDGFGHAKTAAQSFAEVAMSAFSNLGTGIIDAFKKGGDVGMNVLNMLLDKVGQLGESLLNNGLNGLLNMGINALFGGLGGGWGVPGGFGRPGIFGIPGMAEGGTVGRAGLSWVGEKGPELLRLPQGAQVIPNGPSMAMAANQNSGDIVITNVINVPAGAGADVAPAIAREVTKELRRQLPDAIDRHNRNPLRRVS